ncbi:MAG: NCS2 family permease [Spirochaetes bacterium]|nr:MAG: NCS2 family permease [Spirochaetota bacterium]RKY02073.1 MAG: NCS2 family permease [Spirochaetota bacterium]
MVEKLFKFKERGTNAGTEVIAGLATFLAMAYIIVVNPSILSKTGMPFSGVLFATVLVSAFSSIAMGLYANLPFALAPGMGINAFFTFTLVLGMKVPWETALGAVFISGIIFIILSIFKVRITIVKAVPSSIRYAVAAGIGLFLTLIGFEEVGFIVHNPATIVGFGGLTLKVILFLVGLFITSILVIKKVKGALVIGIISTSIITLIVSLVGTATGALKEPIVTIPKAVFALPSTSALFKLDIVGALKFGMIGPIFALLFTDMFDSISTFLGVAQVAGLIDKDGQPINVGKALLVDAGSTTISGLLGTSSGTTYIESAAGVEEGGRTGLTAVIAGLLFLPFMFLSPILSFIPSVATAPVLVIVGVFMMKPVTDLDWKKMDEAIPAFLALILVPLTYSITQGIIWGFLSYTIIKLLIGKAKDIHWMLYIIDAFAILALILPMIQK